MDGGGDGGGVDRRRWRIRLETAGIEGGELGLSRELFRLFWFKEIDFLFFSVSTHSVEEKRSLWL